MALPLPEYDYLDMGSSGIGHLRQGSCPVFIKSGSRYFNPAFIKKIVNNHAGTASIRVAGDDDWYTIEWPPQFVYGEDMT